MIISKVSRFYCLGLLTLDVSLMGQNDSAQFYRWSLKAFKHLEMLAE